MTQKKEKKQTKKLNILSASELTIECYKNTEEKSHIKNCIPGLATCFADLDHITHGFEPSSLVILASRPSVGKSTFASNIAFYVAYELQQPVLFISPSSTSQQVISRILSGHAGIDNQALRTGELDEDDWQRYIIVCDRLHKSPLFIDDTADLYIDELIEAIDDFHKEHSLSLIIIDYVQLLRGFKDKHYDLRSQELSDISRALKGFAKQSKTVILLLSQLSRGAESRDMKRPVLADLRDSGSLEDDADYVIFLHRSDYFDKEDEIYNITNFSVAKNRLGPLGSGRVFFEKRFGRFTNLAKENKK